MFCCRVLRGIKPCNGSGFSSPISPILYRRDSGSIPDLSLWDLWWTTCNRNRFFSEYSSCLVGNISPSFNIYTYTILFHDRCYVLVHLTTDNSDQKHIALSIEQYIKRAKKKVYFHSCPNIFKTLLSFCRGTIYRHYVRNDFNLFHIQVRNCTHRAHRFLEVFM